MFSFIQVELKVVFRHASEVLGSVLGKGPESLNAIDVIPDGSVYYAFAVIDGVMFAMALQRSIALAVC